MADYSIYDGTTPSDVPDPAPDVIYGASDSVYVPPDAGEVVSSNWYDNLGKVASGITKVIGAGADLVNSRDTYAANRQSQQLAQQKENLVGQIDLAKLGQQLRQAQGGGAGISGGTLLLLIAAGVGISMLHAQGH